MLFLLIFCFTVLPALELLLLIELGKAIGTWPTILVVLGTGAAGAFFALGGHPPYCPRFADGYRRFVFAVSANAPPAGGVNPQVVDGEAPHGRFLLPRPPVRRFRRRPAGGG